MLPSSLEPTFRRLKTIHLLETISKMRNYRSGGTPWKAIIDPSGRVVYNDFHIDVEPAVVLMENLLAN